MALLTKYEQAVLAAFHNEAVEMSAEERDQQFLHHIRAWDNAHFYADEAHLDVHKFRRTITRLSGYRRIS